MRSPSTARNAKSCSPKGSLSGVKSLNARTAAAALAMNAFPREAMPRVMTSCPFIISAPIGSVHVRSASLSSRTDHDDVLPSYDIKNPVQIVRIDEKSHVTLVGSDPELRQVL